MIIQRVDLDGPWPGIDPFLFCVHHVDSYPAGNDALGPAASLAGHEMGNDFAGIDGWRMYHGGTVPGFPQHPHRGFETVTVVRRGFIDHFDSLGAQARYGAGDVQWLTTGRGVSHSEMFPLVERDEPNPLELFQIWLNLPRASKLADPHFTMLWADDVPVRVTRDDAGRATTITVVAGALDGVQPPAPPPESWAARPESDLAIWVVELEPGAITTLPAAASDATVRTLYVYGGDVTVDGEAIAATTAVVVHADRPLPLVAGAHGTQILLLQAVPIGEPVAQQGPFVMNERSELEQAFADYRAGRFGVWPFATDDPVHDRAESRFARHPDGRVERPASVARTS